MVEKASVPPSAPASAAPAQQPDPSRIEGSVTALPGRNKFHVNVTGAQTPEPAPAQGDRPAWLPEKFKSPEDLARAYGELERRMGGGGLAPQPAPQSAPQSTPQSTPQPASPASMTLPDGPDVQPQPQRQGPHNLELQRRMSHEFAQTGTVSPETRREFVEKTGLDESYIDTQIQSMQSRGSQAFEMAANRLGSEQAVSELMEWSKGRLSQREREAFNKAVYSGDESMLALAIDGLAAKYEYEIGRPPRVIAGRKPQSNYGGIVPFQSEAELTAAVRDPKYKSDPAFRNLVADRTRVAIELGILNG
jgi:hypothetical protein